METLPQRNKEPERLIDQVEPVLRDIDHQSFSSPAFAALNAKVVQYIGDLVAESGKARKRDSSDIISVKHVEAASENLKQSNRNKIYKHSITLGGVLLGACLSNFYSMLSSNQLTISGFIFTVAAGILGTIFSMIGFMKE